jgi:hypothetical protein
MMESGAALARGDPGFEQAAMQVMHARTSDQPERTGEIIPAVPMAATFVAPHLSKPAYPTHSKEWAR